MDRAWYKKGDKYISYSREEKLQVIPQRGKPQRQRPGPGEVFQGKNSSSPGH